MSDHSFDIIIIGGGNAGFGVSAVASEAGKSIAFVEELDFGGTCPNRGCTPKKVLVAAAHALHEIEHASVHAIEVGKPKLDWAKLIDREKDMVGFIPDAMQSTAEKRGTVYKGSATFTGPNSIQVDGKELTAEHIVIATGSTPRPLPIPGAEHMITSNEVLSEREQPERVVFIGGGVIAMEFSHVYARAGTNVTILEVTPQLLPRLDQDAVAAIQTESERLGIAIKTQTKVNQITQSDNGLTVHYEHEGQQLTIEADRVVNGAGRIANVASLELEKADIKHDGIRIEVDEFLRSTSNPRVWVAGDALVHSAQLSPLATLEGRIVGHNIVHDTKQSPDYSVVPSAVYTVPALASVGMTENEAQQAGLDVNVTQSDMTQWFSGKSYAETVAWSKVLVRKDNDEIIGAHIVGHQGENLIHLFAMAMKFKITASQLKEMNFAFPTFASDVKNLY